jgi:hypothetical protein
LEVTILLSEFTQELKNLVSDMIRDVHTALPGKVVTFYPDRCEADVLPYGKYKKPDGGTLDFPKVPGVPVYFPQGAGQTATIVYPVKPGDECILLFSEQALDIWRNGAASDTDLKFDLTNAVALVGLFAKPNALVKEAVEKDAIIVDRSGTRITMFPDNRAEIIADVTIRGKLTVTDDVTAQSNFEVNGTSKLDQTVTAGADINAAGVVSAGGDGTISGNINLSGNLNVSGIATVGGKNMNTHTHTSNLPGEETSGPNG